MSKSFKKGNGLTESDFKKLSDWLHRNFGKRYSTNYIRRVLDDDDKRKNALITQVASHYLELKQEFEEKFNSEFSLEKPEDGANKEK